MWVYGLDRTGSGEGQVAGTCECGNEPSGYKLAKVQSKHNYTLLAMSGWITQQFTTTCFSLYHPSSGCTTSCSLRTPSFIQVISVPLYSTLFKLQYSDTSANE